MESIWQYSLDKPWFFTNLSFLGALGVFLMLYALVLDKPIFKKLMLIAFSLFFYYKSSGPYLIILISMKPLFFQIKYDLNFNKFSLKF